MFFIFGKCPFLLRWKNVLTGSHALHLRFIRNKSVTHTQHKTPFCGVIFGVFNSENN